MLHQGHMYYKTLGQAHLKIGRFKKEKGVGGGEEGEGKDERERGC